MAVDPMVAAVELAITTPGRRDAGLKRSHAEQMIIPAQGSQFAVVEISEGGDLLRMAIISASPQNSAVFHRSAWLRARRFN